MALPTHLDHLTHHSMYRPYGFDHVEVSGHTNTGEYVKLSILGTCWSMYSSGPSMIMLAEATAELVGPGFYGAIGQTKYSTYNGTMEPEEVPAYHNDPRFA